MAKFKMTDEFRNVYGHICYRIEALEDGEHMKKGDKGGYLEREENLDQSSDAWVGDFAVVFGTSVVTGISLVRGSSTVSDSLINGDSLIEDESKVTTSNVHTSHIYGKSQVRNSSVFNSSVSGMSQVSTGSELQDIEMSGNTIVADGQAHINQKYLHDEVFFVNMHV